MKRAVQSRWAGSTALTLSLAIGLSVLTQGVSVAKAADDAGALADAEEIQEVVVTAEFRRASLQKTPIAITVVTPEVLELRAIENLRDVVTRVPGLAAPIALQHSQTSYYIRGVGESDSIANQTVGTYVDDVYISRPIGGTFELNDVEDIQVLRGPQGTLYGRNSSAGAIKVTTRLPDNELKTFLEIGGGNYSANILRAGISGPIIKDKLAASISYIHRERQGFVYNVTNKQYVGDVQTDSIRFKLNYTVTDRLSLLFAADYFEDNGDPTPKQSRLQPGGVIDKGVNYSDVLISNKTELGGVSLRATYQLNENTVLKSITSTRAFKQPGWYDQDGSATTINKTFSNHRNENWAQEFQYLYSGERLHVVGGLFFLFDNFRSYRTGYSPNATHALLPYRNEFLQERMTLQDSGEKTKNQSVYGQLTYQWTPSIEVIVGGRYTSEQHDFTFTGDERNASGQYLPVPYTIRRDYKTWTSFTPKVGINWQASERIAAYLTWSKGFKAGGFDGRANSKEAAGLPYDPEYVVAIEGGIKADFFNRTLRTNLAIFHNEVEGYQATARDENDVSHRINLGEVETRGFELETTWRPLNGLTWLYNVSYLDSEVLTAGGAASNTATFVGKQVQNAPKWSHFLSVDYVLPITTFGQYRLGAEYIQRSKYYTDGPNTESAAAEAVDLVNLSASFLPENAQNWRVSFTVRNLFDEQYDTGGARGNGVTSLNATTYSDPRTWFVRLRYAY